MLFREQFVNLYRDLAQIDINDLALIYHPDIVLIDPVTTHRGLAAVSAYFDGLLKATESCQFEISNWRSIANDEPRQTNSASTGSTGASDCTDVLEWTMKLKLNGKSTWIEVAGVTLLTVVNDKIIYHRDYYDLGEMVYEHVPLLKHIITFIKKKLTS